MLPNGYVLLLIKGGWIGNPIDFFDIMELTMQTVQISQ